MNNLLNVNNFFTHNTEIGVYKKLKIVYNEIMLCSGAIPIDLRTMNIIKQEYILSNVYTIPIGIQYAT